MASAEDEVFSKPTPLRMTSVDNMVRMLPLDNNLFEIVSTSGSDISEISAPFSDYGIYLDTQDTSGKSERLEEKDLFSTLFFSEDFRNLMKEMKAENLEQNPELSEAASMMYETPDQIKVGAILNVPKRKIPIVVQMKICSLLNDKALRFKTYDDEGEEEEIAVFVPDEKKTWEDIKDEIMGGKNILKEIKKLTKRERSRKQLLKKQEENIAYETMSGYWRLLSLVDDFCISPPGYDAYGQEEPHWLQTKPVPYEIYEGSRTKCLDWLSRHFLEY